MLQVHCGCTDHNPRAVRAVNVTGRRYTQTKWRKTDAVCVFLVVKNVA